MSDSPVSQYVGSCAPFVQLFPYGSSPAYMPCSVDWYLNQVVLHNVNGTTYQPPAGTNFDQTKLPTTKFPPKSTLPYLEIPDPTATSPARLGNLSTAVAYVHIRPVPNSSALFDLQYWLYYAIRGRTSYRLVGPSLDYGHDLLAPPNVPYKGPGEHQGDWKHVTVRINLQGTIQAIFYAQHGSGFWCLPDQFQTTTAGNPIVYSARNTHSCFPQAGRFNQLGTFKGVLDYGVSLLEWTEDGGETWDCSQSYQLLDDSPPTWLGYTGLWGPTIDEVVNQASFEGLTRYVPGEYIAREVKHKITELAQTFIPNPEKGGDNPPQQSPWLKGDGTPPGGGWQVWNQVQSDTQAGHGAGVTAVWRNDGKLDLFMTDKNGVVQWCWTNETLSFTQSAWTPIQVNKVAANGGASVTALWRDRKVIDLFMTGTDGTVWWTWGKLRGGVLLWQESWLAIQRSTKAQPGGTVTAVWRGPTSLDLWMTGQDGTVWWTEGLRTDQGLEWSQPWSAIQNQKKAQKGAPVTVVWQTPFVIDIFMSGQDGTVYWTYGNVAESGITWTQIWTSIGASSAKANPGAAVTALWRDAAHIDLFMTGTDGKVWWTWGWIVENALSFPEGWTAIQSSIKAKAGAAVTALWQDSQLLNLWMAAGDGTVYWTTTTTGMNWSNPWTPLLPSIAKAYSGAPITALWNDPDRFDIFMANGFVWHSWLPVE